MDKDLLAIMVFVGLFAVAMVVVVRALYHKRFSENRQNRYYCPHCKGKFFESAVIGRYGDEICPACLSKDLKKLT